MHLYFHFETYPRSFCSFPPTIIFVVPSEWICAVHMIYCQPLSLISNDELRLWEGMLRSCTQRLCTQLTHCKICNIKVEFLEHFPLSNTLQSLSSQNLTLALLVPHPALAIYGRWLDSRPLVLLHTMISLSSLPQLVWRMGTISLPPAKPSCCTTPYTFGWDVLARMPAIWTNIEWAKSARRIANHTEGEDVIKEKLDATKNDINYDYRIQRATKTALTTWTL